MKISQLKIISLILVCCIGLSCIQPMQATGLFPECTKRNVGIMLASGLAFMILIAILDEVYHDRARGGGPLHRASRDNDLERVKRLVQEGRNIHHRSNCYSSHPPYISIYGTPLQVACACGSLDVVKYLLENGAHIEDFGGSRRSALCIAMDYTQLDVVKYLIEKGANIKEVRQDRSSLVHEAVLNDRNYYNQGINNTRSLRNNFLKYLLQERGEDPNYKNRYRNSPLSFASGYSNFNPETIKILIDNGANICDVFTRGGGSLKQCMERMEGNGYTHDLCETFKRQIEKQENLQTILDNIANNSSTLEEDKDTIKNYIADGEVPPYIKLSAIAMLANSYFSDDDIVGREELIGLMRHAQFNYRFFHDVALRNAVCFAVRTDAVDFPGRTAIQAAPIYIHDANAVTALIAQSGSIFYRRRFDFENNRTAFRKSLEIFENDEAEKDEFEKILKKTKDTKNKGFFRSLGNTAIVVEDLQKELIVKDEQNQDKIHQSGFPPELAVKITDYIGGDYGKTLYFKREQPQQRSRQVQEKEKMS